MTLLYSNLIKNIIKINNSIKINILNSEHSEKCNGFTMIFF